MCILNLSSAGKAPCGVNTISPSSISTLLLGYVVLLSQEYCGICHGLKQLASCL